MSNIHSVVVNIFKGTDVLKNITELAEIVQTSDNLMPNWHALGFIHCKLAINLLTHETFRLHIWPVDLAHNSEQADKVHDHLFHVDSIVLSGAIRNKSFELLKLPKNQSTHRLACISYEENQARIIETGRYGVLNQLDRKDIFKLDRYTVTKGQLHATERISEEIAITLVRTYEPIIYKPVAVFDINRILPPPRRPIPMDLIQWRKIISKTLLDYEF